MRRNFGPQVMECGSIERDGSFDSDAVEGCPQFRP